MNTRYIVLLLAVVSVSLSGCQLSKFSREDLGNLNPIKRLAGKKKIAAEVEEFKDPARMAVIWSSSVYDKAGSGSVRGFGARIYFYGTEGEAIKADGELVVYGYDDDTENESLDADRKFVFERAKFQTHYSETGMGPSYSVWVPWDAAGGVRKTVSLVPIFVTGTGKRIQGGHSVNILNGTDPVTEEGIDNSISVLSESFHDDIDDGSKVVLAGGFDEIDSDVEESSRSATKSRTTSIKLNHSMKQRLSSRSSIDLNTRSARAMIESRKPPRRFSDKTDSVSTESEPTELGLNEVEPALAPKSDRENTKRLPASYDRVFGSPGVRN